MELRQIQAAILARGIAVKALDQLVAKVQVRFGDSTHVTPHDLEQFLDGLDVWDRLGMDRQEFEAQPWSWRMEQGHLFAPPPAGAHPRRPTTRSLTSEELAAHDAQAAREGWSPAEYRERARVLQQTPLPPQP